MKDSLRPDEVIQPRGESSVQVRALVKDVVLMLPNLLKLLARLLRDPRVPRRSKLLVGGTLGYLASPIDLIPDAVPGLGMADDVILVLYAVNHLINKAGEEVVLEHWDGPQDLLEMIRSLLDTLSQMIPAPVQRWVNRLSG